MNNPDWHFVCWDRHACWCQTIFDETGAKVLVDRAGEARPFEDGVIVHTRQILTGKPVGIEPPRQAVLKMAGEKINDLRNSDMPVVVVGSDYAYLIKDEVLADAYLAVGATLYTYRKPENS